MFFKHYNVNQKDEGTLDNRGRDGETNFILKIKEQETRLTLQEHDDDDKLIYIIYLFLNVVGVRTVQLSSRDGDYLLSKAFI